MNLQKKISKSTLPEKSLITNVYFIGIVNTIEAVLLDGFNSIVATEHYIGKNISIIVVLYNNTKN